MNIPFFVPAAVFVILVLGALLAWWRLRAEFPRGDAR
jgi:hypothetical protein